MRVLLFAGLAEAVGRASVELQEPTPDTVAELLSVLAEAYPQASWQGVRIAVDQAYAEPAARLDSSMEIAAIPPVSGG